VKAQIQSKEGKLAVFTCGASALVNCSLTAWQHSLFEVGDSQLVFTAPGIPIEHQRLIYAGRQLEDDQSLSQYDIETGALLIIWLTSVLLCQQRLILSDFGFA
jgi:hypothetical protein